MRNENSLITSEREKSQSFLFENFSRSRLLSMSETKRRKRNDKKERTGLKKKDLSGHRGDRREKEEKEMI